MTDILSTVFIIGPRGAGKTSVGRELARKLDCAFSDTDALVCDHAAKTVAEIVEEEGWSGFRQRERQALELASKESGVVSTGGGVVLDEANRLHMRSAGLVLFLSAEPHVLHERLSRNTNEAQRPPLTGRSLLEEIEVVLAEREPLYRETAHHCLDATAPLPKVVAAIMRILKRRKGSYL